jgi:hypothetical protein
MLYLVYLQNFISKYNILWLMQKKQMIREWHTILFSQMFFIFAQKNYHHSTIVFFFFEKLPASLFKYQRSLHEELTLEVASKIKHDAQHLASCLTEPACVPPHSSFSSHAEMMYLHSSRLSP